MKNLLLKRLLISIQIRLSRIWRETPFFIQGQMDIHPSSPWHNADFMALTGGFFPRGSVADRRMLDHECWDGVRRDMLILLLRSVEERKVEGSFAELGVYRGGTARLIHHYAPERRLHLFDTFSGFDDRDGAKDKSLTNTVDTTLFRDTNLELARSSIGLLNGNVHFHKGFFPETFTPELRKEGFAFVHLDADLYEPMLAGLKNFYPLLSRGGIIVAHDYNAWIGSRKAVDEFCAETGIIPIPMPDKSGSCVILKSY
jgi:O-methyltransferase